MAIRVIALPLYGSTAASTRYRLEQYTEGLKFYGIELSIAPLLGNEYIRRSFQGKRYSLFGYIRDYFRRFSFLLFGCSSYDVAIVYGELFPLLPGFIESRLVRMPYLYDFDDAFFIKYRLKRFRAVSLFLKNKFDVVFERAAHIMAGNNYLATQARSINVNTTLLPTVLDLDRYHCRPKKMADFFTVGWIGSPSTSVYLPMLHAALQAIGREGPVKFVVVGGTCAYIDGVEVINLPWSEATEVDLINTFDIGVMPLFDDEWAKGKCGFKLIQYMACGVPVVGSSVGANVDIISVDCGFIATTSEDWLKAFRILRDDSLLREHMGACGRRVVEQNYSLQVALPVMAATIKAVYSKYVLSAE